MVSEQVHTRFHSGEHFIYLCLARVSHARKRKGARRFMREKHVDPVQHLQRVDFLMYKMASPIVARRQPTQLTHMLLVPCRSERSTQAGQCESVCLHFETVGNVVQVRKRTASGGL